MPAQFNSPTDIVIDSQQNQFVTDNYSRIRKITPNGRVSTLPLPINGIDSRFINFSRLEIDQQDNLYFCNSNKIYRLSPDGRHSVLIDPLFFSENLSDFYPPSGLTIDREGNIYIAPLFKKIIYKFTSFGERSIFAGEEGVGGREDGFRSDAKFSGPRGLVCDSDGNLYVADSSNHSIRKITPDGRVSTFAGGRYGRSDGIGTLAEFCLPEELAIDCFNNIYVADSLNSNIRKITPEGVVSTIAVGTLGDSDGVGSEAQFCQPRGLAVDRVGNIYVADVQNHRIRKITPDGVVSTFAGSTQGYQDGLTELAIRRDAEFLHLNRNLRIQLPREFTLDFNAARVALLANEELARNRILTERKLDEIVPLFEKYLDLMGDEIGNPDILSNPDLVHMIYLYRDYVSTTHRIYNEGLVLNIFNQLYFFANSTPQYAHLVEPIKNCIQKVILFYPKSRELVQELVNITASDSIDDLLQENLFFFSCNTQHAILISKEYFEKFFLKNNRPEYSHVQLSSFYLYRYSRRNKKYELVPPGQIKLVGIFKQFAFFPSLLFSLTDRKLLQLTNYFFAENERILKAVHFALSASRINRSYVDFEFQNDLSTLMERMYINTHNTYEIKIAPHILHEIYKIFEITNPTLKEKNIFHFMLARLFVRLSASQFLGSESDSPVGFRLFAVASLNEILNPLSVLQYSSSILMPHLSELQISQIISREDIIDWKNRLLGYAGAFTCTDILDGILEGKMKLLPPNQFKDVLNPPVWQ